VDTVLMRMPQDGGWLPRLPRLVALIPMVSLMLPGCALAPRSTEVGGGTVYMRGELSRPHAGTYGRVWVEALRAVKGMGWELIRAERDSLGGMITARRRDDTSISLQVNPTGADTTIVKVRVGTTGDWAASERIQTRISRGLRDQIEIGTGFVVRPDGMLVTAWHIVQAGGVVSVACPDQPPQLASPLEISRIHDVAILRVPLSGLPYLSLSEAGSLRLGDPVFTIGFPVADLLGSDPKFTDGAVSALSGLGGDASLMQVTVPIQPGNSGGAVLTSEGEVVGVVVSSAAVQAFLTVTGTLPQNLNWAVKAEYVRPLFEPPAAQPRASSRRAAIDRALQATCLIEVRR
jgi:S1-C subfamily serine protease